MKKVNINEAKTRLSELVDKASKGEPFVITRAGKPMVEVAPFGTVTGRPLGFMSGQLSVPKDFDRMNRREIEQMFAGESEAAAVKTGARLSRKPPL